MSTAEELLVKQYVPFFLSLGENPADAERQAREMVASAANEVAQRGLQNEPRNYGDWLIAKSANDPKMRSGIDRLLEEGVREEDIRSWWNQPPIARILLLKTDEMFRLGTMLGFLRQGSSAEEAGLRASRAHPKWGDATLPGDESRPLPVELKHRVIGFLERQYGQPDAWKRRLEEFGTFNALVRDALRRGEL